MAGYHSPQIDVAVRLNTNESPEPPPAGFAEAVAEGVLAIDWHRYPERSASELRARIGVTYGLSEAQVFAANGSNEVLQTLLLTFAGPGRVSAVFEPTYALHSHLSRVTGTTVIQGERADDFSIDLAEVERAAIRDRTTEALAALRRSGRAWNHAPFGFCAQRGRLVEAPTEQACLARALELRSVGLSLRAVCAALEAEGHLGRTGKPLKPGSLARILERHQEIES